MQHGIGVGTTVHPSPLTHLKLTRVHKQFFVYQKFNINNLWSNFDHWLVENRC